MKCLSCGSYFKPSKFSGSVVFCEHCDAADQNYDILDEELNVELGVLFNPTGKTQACISEDRED
jgi:hypothetical protein